jgi:hypothetical protein
MKGGTKLAVVMEEFALGSPSQQIFDRFLIGFTRDGVFEKAPQIQDLRAWTREADQKFLERRFKEKHYFLPAKSRADAVGAADRVILIQAAGKPNEQAFIEVIQNMRMGAPLFVYGLIGATKASTEKLLKKASERLIPVCAGTAMSTLQELPPLDIPNEMAVGARIREALIVVEGPAPDAESSAFDAIASILDRNGGVPNIRNVRTLEGNAVWDAGGRDWSWRLLASALSRTDKAQGNTLLDGRTEDIVGLGLTQKMAKNPRARIIEQSHGLRTTILVLDGVVGDIVVAVKAGRRFMAATIYSTQLFQSPTPQEEHFSRLAAVISDFFTGKPPWEIKRSIVAADFAERIGRSMR